MLLAEQRVGWGGECVCECVCVVVGVVTGGGEGSDGIFTSSCSWEACVCGGRGGGVTAERVAMVYPPPVALGKRVCVCVRAWWAERGGRW